MPQIPVDDLARYLNLVFGTWWEHQRHLPSPAEEVAQLIEGVMQWTAATITHLCGVVTGEHHANHIDLVRSSLERYGTIIEDCIASLTPGDPHAP